MDTSASAVGLIRGMAESTALIVKVSSSVLSDYLSGREILAILGHAMGAANKHQLAIAPTASIVPAARRVDRAGKGIRGAVIGLARHSNDERRES